MFTSLCFSENLLVAATNCFKVLKLFFSLKVTVYIQYRRLRSEKVLDILGFEWRSNCTEVTKYTYDFKHKIERERERERNLARQFTLHSAEAYSEPFPTSKQGAYLTGGNYFQKNIHLRCLKRF